MSKCGQAEVTEALDMVSVSREHDCSYHTVVPEVHSSLLRLPFLYMSPLPCACCQELIHQQVTTVASHRLVLVVIWDVLDNIGLCVFPGRLLRNVPSASI